MYYEISKVSDPNPSDPTVTRKWKASDLKLVTPATRQLPEDRKLVTRTCYPSDPTATRKWKASDPNLVTPVTWQLPEERKLVTRTGYPSPSEEFDLTKMSWGDHDILTVTSHDYLTATSF